MKKKTLFLLYFGDRVIVPVKCCLTYIYLFTCRNVREEEYQGSNVYIIIHREEYCQKGCIKVQVERDEHANNDQTSANKNHKINAGFNREEREVSLGIFYINCHR